MNKFLGITSAFCFCIAPVVLSGCGGGSHNSSNSEPAALTLNTNTTFQVGETRRVENTNITIKLDAITQDTRDAEGGSPSFTGGEVIFRLLVSDSVNKNEVFLFSQFKDGRYGMTVPQTQTRGSYNIDLQGIEPRFGSGGTRNTEQYLSQKDYKITLRVTQP